MADTFVVLNAQNNRGFHQVLVHSEEYKDEGGSPGDYFPSSYTNCREVGVVEILDDHQLLSYEVYKSEP